MTPPPGLGELPSRLVEADGTIAVEFVRVPTSDLTHAFLHGDLSPDKVVGVRTIALGDVERWPVYPPLAAFVVHVGRTGSTLLCRALDAAGPVVTFREPLVFADLLGWDGVTTVPPTVVRPLAAAFETWARGRGCRGVVKLTSTASRHATALARALPESRPVAIVRDPVAVVTSMVASPPPWADDFVGSFRARARLAASYTRGVDDAVATATASWCRSVDGILALHKSGPITIIAYGALVGDLVSTVTRILADSSVALDREPPSSLTALATSDAKDRSSEHRSPAPLPESEVDRVRSETSKRVQALARIGINLAEPPEGG